MRNKEGDIPWRDDVIEVEVQSLKRCPMPCARWNWKTGIRDWLIYPENEE